MIIYLSGPYSSSTPEGIEENIQAARRVAVKLTEDYSVITPHLNTIHFEQDCNCTWEEYLQKDLEIIARVDAVVMLPGWENSDGARIEKQYAENHEIPVSIYPDLPDISSTEISRPRQVEYFIHTVMKMYRVHLSKNQDYSPANILGAGEIGLMTRTWDKVSRLMNLMGFKIEIASSIFRQPTRPKNESIDDSILDLAVYGVIWILFRLGVWGR